MSGETVAAGQASADGPGSDGPDADGPDPRLGPIGGPSREELFETLSNQRRRYVVRYLANHDGEVDIRTLSEQVAAWENGKPVEAVTSTERHRVYNALQQVHLPKMAGADLIGFDRGTVEPTAAIDDLEVYLEVVPRNDVPWSVYYLLLGVLGLLLGAAALLGVPPFDALPGAVWLVAFAGLLVVSAAVNAIRQRRMRLGFEELPSEEW